jgi:hypothetical protein
MVEYPGTRDEVLPAGEPGASADVGNAVSPSDPSPEDERLRLEVTDGDASFSAEVARTRFSVPSLGSRTTVPVRKEEGVTESRFPLLAVGAGQVEKRHPATYLGILRRLSMKDGSNV